MKPSRIILIVVVALVLCVGIPMFLYNAQQEHQIRLNQDQAEVNRLAGGAGLDDDRTLEKKEHLLAVQKGWKACAEQVADDVPLKSTGYNKSAESICGGRSKTKLHGSIK